MTSRGGNNIDCPALQHDIPFQKGLILPVESVLVQPGEQKACNKYKQFPRHQQCHFRLKQLAQSKLFKWRRKHSVCTPCVSLPCVSVHQPKLKTVSCAPNGCSCALSFHVHFLSCFHATEPFLPGLPWGGTSDYCFLCICIFSCFSQSSLGHKYNCKNSKFESFLKWSCHSICCYV